MTYIELINAFWRWTSSNEISHAEVDLYFSILNVANTTNWKTRLSIPNSTFGRFDKNLLSRTRQGLINKGLIRYQRGKKGVAPIYIINEIGVNINPLYDTNNDINSDTNSDTNMLPKQGTYIDKDKDKTNITPIIPFDGKLKEKVSEWLAYKAERREKYKDTGLKAFFTKVQNLVNECGESAVINALDTAMANNWKGFFPKADDNTLAVYRENYSHDDLENLTRR